MSATEHLVRLGLSVNDAKALDALIALGPSGASDVHRYADMPRNKVYESLERLSGRGIVEVQSGRPTLYRAMGVKAIIEHLTESYGNDARQALGALESREALSGQGDGETGGEGASAWVVKGEMGVRKKLAELVYGARSDIFGVGGYPPKYFLSAKTALKAAAGRGVNVRVVCMIRPTEDVEGVSSDDSSVIEFRTVKASPTLRVRIQPYDEKIVGEFAGMSGVGAMVIVDERVAFDIVDPGTDPKKAAGIVFGAPGIPGIQKATAERVLGLYTRKL